MELTSVPRVANITKEEFIQHYFKPQKPLVVTNAVDHWPAITKWSLEYMAKVAGEKKVPLYDDRPVKHEDGFNEPHAEMKMSEYVDLLKSAPTRYRIFLWNIFKEVPRLKGDFDIPDFGVRIQKTLPMLFLEEGILLPLCITISISPISFIFILREKKSVYCSRLLKRNTCIRCRIL